MDEDEIVRDFLGAQPEAARVREWRQVLEQRLRAMEREISQGGPGVEALRVRAAQTRKQIDALIQEEAVSRFVEDSVRATLHMGAVADLPLKSGGGAEGE